MNKQNIDKIKIYEMQSQRQSIQNQKHKEQGNADLELQLLRLSQCKKPSLISAKWEFYEQYIQFFEISQITSKLNEIFNRYENQSNLPDYQTEDSHVKELFNNKSKIQKIIKILQTKLIPKGFEIIIDQIKTQYKSSQKEVDIEISLINNTKTYEIIELFCRYGRYSKKYTVLNIFQQSFNHSLSVLGMGGMGEVYLKKCFQDHTYCAIKCLKIDSHSQIHLKNAIRQFFITDLLSSFQIAPKIIRNMGFDFIIFDKCVEFELEKCESFKVDNIEPDLKENLLFMHLLKFVHNDIKPNNIMYSPSFQKNIFIDFGISEHLNQSFGQKTFTKFKGTYQFCSDEMQAIVCSRNPVMIDIYKNDIVMLTKSFPTMKPYLENSPKINKRKYQNKEHIFQIVEIQTNIIYLEKKTKFYLYKNKSKIKLNSQINQIFFCVEDLKDEDALQYYVKQIFHFTSRFKPELTCLLLEQALFKNYEYMLNMEQFTEQSIFPSQNKRNWPRLNYLAKIKRQRIDLLQKLNSEMISQQDSSSENLQKNKIEFIFIEAKNKMKIENIQFILFEAKQAIKLKREDYFELFINYSSIWSRNYKETTMSKRLTASIILKQVVAQNQNYKDFQYLKEVYFPDDSCIRTEYKDLIWAYGYLLSYCFSEQTNQFKAKHILIIVKQTILLNFKYCFFLDKAFVLYIQYLIRNKVPKIFSLISIHKCQLMWLAKVHYSYIALSRQQFKNAQIQIEVNQQQILCLKFNLMQIRKVINDNKYNQQKCYIKYKQKSLLAICSEYKQNTYYQEFIQNQKLLQQIDNQIFELEKLGDLHAEDQYYKYLLTIATCYISQYQNQFEIKNELKFKTKLSKLYSNLDRQQASFPQSLFQLLPKRKKINKQVDQQKFLAKLDFKINCQKISRYFFLDLRLNVSIARNNKLQFAKLISILSIEPTFLYLNDQIMKKVIQQKLQIKDILGKQQMLNQEEVNKNYSFIIQRSQQKTIDQVISQRYQQFIFNVNNFYVLNLRKHLLNFSASLTIDTAQQINKIYPYIKKNISKSYLFIIKKFIIQKLGTIIQQTIIKNKNKISQLLLRYHLLVFQLICIQQQKQSSSSESLNFIRKQKQLHQCLYLICKMYPFSKQISNFSFNPQQLLSDPILIEIMKRDFESVYFDNKIELGWQNFKLRILLFSQNTLIEHSYQLFYAQLVYQKKYNLISQMILINSYILWNNKCGQLLNILNYQLKELQFTKEKQIIFCTELIQKISKLTNSYLDQTYLFVIFIHFLNFQHYLNGNKVLWKKLLFLVCKNVEKYPKLTNQEQNLKLKRKEQIMLRSLIFQQQNLNYRKKMIMTRKWIKIIQDQSPFERKQSSNYLKRYLKNFRKNLQILHVQKIYVKQYCLIQNMLLFRNICFAENQLQSVPFFSSIKIQTQLKNFSQYTKPSVSYVILSRQNQEAKIYNQLKYQFCQRYGFKNLQLFIKQNNNHQFLKTYKQMLHLQQKLSFLKNQIQHCKESNQKLWLMKIDKLQKLRKQHFQKQNQLKQKISLVTESQYYKRFTQIWEIQLKILQQERINVIRELVKQNKIYYNQNKGKYETIKFHGCFQVKFSKNDTIF